MKRLCDEGGGGGYIYNHQRMPVLSIEQFKKIGGEPSGKFFSTYTDLCKAIVELDKLREYGSNYVPKAYQDKLLAFHTKMERFHPNDTTAAAAKKNNEISAVRAMKESMTSELQ